MACKGGAMLAFALDAELRAHAEPGLPYSMRDLLQRENRDVDLGVPRDWCEDQGLEEF